MTNPTLAASAAVALMMLGACGGPAAPGGTEQAAKPAANAALKGWNPLDACASVGQAAVAKASGSAVTSAELSQVSPGDQGRAAFSMCTFKLASGGQVMVLTRQAPYADATPAAIEAARTGGGNLPPAADVPGLGKAALWSDVTSGLQVFLDGTRYVSVNTMGLSDGKAASVAVARTLL